MITVTVTATTSGCRAVSDNGGTALSGLWPPSLGVRVCRRLGTGRPGRQSRASRWWWRPLEYSLAGYYQTVPRFGGSIMTAGARIRRCRGGPGRATRRGHGPGQPGGRPGPRRRAEAVRTGGQDILTEIRKSAPVRVHDWFFRG